MDWADVIKTLITAIASVIVALVTAGYFRKTQDKNKEKKVVKNWWSRFKETN
jgi:hypothetical protein